MFIDDSLSQYAPDPFLKGVEFKFMIRGFFDDSGKESDPSNRIVCIAGYCAVDIMWGQFHEHWRNVLMKHDMSWLHMKDFIHDQDEYKGRGWDWPKKREILEDFVNAIKVYNLVGFGVAVDLEAWNKLPEVVRKDTGDVQLFCFTRIMKMLCNRVQKVSTGDSITMCFDLDENFTPARFQRFLKYRKRFAEIPKHFPAMMIADARVYIPLQAADFLAWETRKDLLRQAGGHESKPEFISLFQMMPSTPPDYTAELWDASTLPKLEREHEQRVSELQQSNAGTSKDSSRGDQGEIGSGEGREKAEES